MQEGAVCDLSIPSGPHFAMVPLEAVGRAAGTALPPPAAPQNQPKIHPGPASGTAIALRAGLSEPAVPSCVPIARLCALLLADNKNYPPAPPISL